MMVQLSEKTWVSNKSELLNQYLLRIQTDKKKLLLSLSDS